MDPQALAYLLAFYVFVVESSVLRLLENDGQDCNAQRPLVGVLTQPGRPAPAGFSYVAASYVKFIETGGARAVPILYDSPKDEIVKRFRSINGVLIPGGGQRLSPGHLFYDASALLVQLAMEAWDHEGMYFPVWGTCLGFEALAVILSGNTSILGHFDAENHPSTLRFLPSGQSSMFLQNLPGHVVEYLQQEAVAMENHVRGVAPEAVLDDPTLSSVIDMVAVSKDRQGKEYVSMFQAKQYPIFGVQFHPEKNAFEWTLDLDIPHSPHAVEVTQAMANLLVGEARKNCQAPANEKELEELLIYNYQPVFTGQRRNPGMEVDFDECYVFPELNTSTAA